MSKSSIPEFDPDNFSGDEIDNPYLPFEEGSLWIYQGEESLNSVFVTDGEKEILGVDATVVLDLEFSEGQLVELTQDWYAQDEDGNVWYLGEDTAEIEDGEIVSREGSWEAGVDGAEAGLVMLAKPKVGLTYAEENAPGVAEDMATVISLNESVDVAFGSFHHVLQTDNFNPLDPNAVETKFYAKGVGNILTIDESEEEQLIFFHEGNDDDHDDANGEVAVEVALPAAASVGDWDFA